MRLLIVRQLAESPSFWGTLAVDGGEAHLMTAEREWADNEPGRSCVPPGFYILEPHDGRKYKGTMAIIGDSVGHFPGPGIKRSACVLHWARNGSGLQGCIAIGEKMLLGPTGGELLGKEAGTEFITSLRAAPGPHYLTIR